MFNLDLRVPRRVTSSPVIQKVDQTGSMLNFARGVPTLTHKGANTARRAPRVRKSLPGMVPQSFISLQSLTRRPFALLGEHHAAHHDPGVSVVPTRDAYLVLEKAPAGVAHCGDYRRVLDHRGEVHVESCRWVP